MDTYVQTFGDVLQKFAGDFNSNLTVYMAVFVGFYVVLSRL